ncbi:hypothetical protein [Actinoplanes solisilvae]|uniref:hypothetical protein n=1 Tax=Actinoplanes solisilvae TaxID=2486853 RepID=UPI000FDC8EDC|nr:hypothetical protein [Actinoplanes solisilvae]
MSVKIRGRLDWWANRSTLLASVEVSLEISTDGADWTARGDLTTDDDREGFAFLCELDPVFSLRFDDESTVTVVVHPSTGSAPFTLTEYTGPNERPIEHRVELRPGFG